ncbi:helix-turn-helix domain-containing protein [Limnochorda pilosa]|uniref:Helix-turn-helix domain-containing protein n=1 Tax=Limnochorda pilosa TaxID=1555112 RepID=A0A0K2SQK5_LIMPI|nr:helix-turn-helix domain-containing protein [Limnochorda pilosa]BAS29386.1 hypothetical protein LIP_3575 [Limnochorda pilosa]
MQELVNANYVCERLSISKAVLSQMIRRGEIACVNIRPGGKRPTYRFPKAWIDRLVDGQLARFGIVPGVEFKSAGEAQ